MLYAEMVLIRGLFGDEETLTPSCNGSFQVDPSKCLIRFIFMVVLWFQKLNNHQTKDDAIMDIIYKVDSYIVRIWIVVWSKYGIFKSLIVLYNVFLVV